MVIVDTHLHASPWWYEPIEVILFQMDSNSVDKAVLVQIRSQTDNSYFLDCVHKYPGRFCAVIRVQEDSPGAPEELERWVRLGAAGIRLNATDRSPGPDPLALWRKAAELNIPVSCNGGLEDFISPEFKNLVEALPDLSIVIEHQGGGGRDTSPPHAKFQEVLKLAQYPNTTMKIDGLGEIAPRPIPDGPFAAETVPPLAQMACEAFGPRRLMWGSNYPPVSRNEGYANSLRQPMELYSSFLKEEDRDWFFGGTALRVFGFPQAE